MRDVGSIQELACSECENPPNSRQDTRDTCRESNVQSKSPNLVYVCPCIVYEIDERYPLDATIYLLL